MNFLSPAVLANPHIAWDLAVRTLQHAGAGADHILFGFGPEPVYVPISALHAHVYALGASDAGKSSRVLAPTIAQLIIAGRPVWTIDCKPDPLLWGHIKAAATAAGRTVRFFSLQPGIASEFGLDFFEALRLGNRTPRQIAELLIGSLGLNKAAEPFFVTQNAGAVRLAIERGMRKGRLSFRAIAHELRGLTTEKRFEHAGHALDAFESLADVPELNPPRNGEGPPSIDFARLIEQGSVCYFCMPVSTEAKLTAATAASLLLKLAVAVSKDLAIRGRSTKRLFLAVDEFQDIGSTADLKELMAQVRGVGGGISLILSHQVEEQIEDEGLRALLKSAGVMVCLSPRQLAAQLQEWSGEKSVWIRSEGMNSSYSYGTEGSWSEGMSVGYTETIRPALDLNAILEVHRIPGCGFAMIAGDPPRPLFFPHHVSRAEGDRRAADAFRPSEKLRAQSTPLDRRTQKEGRAAEAGKARPQTPKPFELPLSVRIQKLFVRLRPTTLVSALRASS